MVLIASRKQGGMMTGNALLTLLSVLSCLAALAYGITWQEIRLSNVSPFLSRSRGSLSQATWQKNYNYVLAYGRTVRPPLWPPTADLLTFNFRIDSRVDLWHCVVRVDRNIADGSVADSAQSVPFLIYLLTPAKFLCHGYA